MDARGTLRVGSETYEIFRLDALQDRWDVARLPYSLRVLLENALRAGSDHDVEAIAGWVATEEPRREISFGFFGSETSMRVVPSGLRMLPT